MHMFFTSYDTYMANLVSKGVVKTVEFDIAEKGLEFKPYARSQETTREIAGMIKERTKGVPLVAVPVHTTQPYLDNFQDIFSQLSVPYLSRPAKKIKSLEKQGVNFAYKNVGHWNVEGHQIFGRVLSEDVKALLKSGHIELPETTP